MEKRLVIFISHTQFISINNRILMRYLFLILLVSISLFGCQEPASKKGTLVNDATELKAAIENAQPGDEIILVNGSWKDVEIRFSGEGTASKPITLRAETPGKVIIEGESDLKLGGKYLVVSGLHFKNGRTPSRAVIEFRIDKTEYANHCRVTECVIEDFNQLQRSKTDLWVQLRGRHNQLDHCYIAGKSNRGPTVRVDLEGNESIKNYHKIVHNHFGPRPPKGGPSAETIQIGNSYTSMAPSYTLVANNFFERCNGEVEVISSKTNFNEFRNNVFYKSEGSLVTRHGNYCILDGNYFIGDENSAQIGGIRLIGTGHWVTNNYFYNLKGQNFRSPLAVMNGIPKSPLNRYIQVTDVVVANNSWINCVSPLQFGVGSNVSQKDVLPASEIRSARPIRTTVANNLIYNEKGDTEPVVAHDKLDGINFQRNVINNQGVDFEALEGISKQSFSLSALSDNIMIPTADFPEVELFEGFEFETIEKDLLGNSRAGKNKVGAVSGNPAKDPQILNGDLYGTSWYTQGQDEKEPNTHTATPANLAAKITEANPGDIIELEGGSYELASSLVINKALTIRSKDKNKIATLTYAGAAQTPAFEMNPKGLLTLQDVKLEGKGEQYAFASLKENMSSLYNLTVENCEISNFDYILKGYKFSFSEYLSFKNSSFSNCENGIELSEETNDKGDYNAENITIDNCEFKGISQNVIDYYRGGYDESTVGGTLIVTNSTFTNCGAKEKNGILLNTYGIINVRIDDNTFSNNQVKLIARLWGAKDNTASGNDISNSGKIVTEENLKLNLLY